MNNSTNNGTFLHLPTQLDAGELDPLAVECAAQRAEIRGRFTSERCASNLGGTYHSVIGGEAHVCVVPAP